MYPNPASTIINLMISQFDNLKMNNIEIYNTIGECVLHQIITSPSPPSKGETFTIDVSNLPKGVYQLIIQNSEFTIKATGKVIVIN
ncbi:MAG: T9SS type A sorting domain-containing protein [Bacteroidia bacterium]